MSGVKFETYNFFQLFPPISSFGYVKSSLDNPDEKIFLEVRQKWKTFQLNFKKVPLDLQFKNAVLKGPPKQISQESEKCALKVRKLS